MNTKRIRGDSEKSDIDEDGETKMNKNDENQEVQNAQETPCSETENIEQLRLKCDEYKTNAEENKIMADEYLNSLKSLKAEFENYRKREMQYRQNFIKSSNKELILKLLPVIDDMDNAIQESKKSDVQSSFVEGTELIYRKFLNILDKEGVRQIQTVGEKFDPKYHEALMTVSLPEYEDYAIVEELRKGYMLNDEVIRAAQVSVNRLNKDELTK